MHTRCKDFTARRGANTSTVNPLQCNILSSASRVARASESSECGVHVIPCRVSEVSWGSASSTSGDESECESESESDLNQDGGRVSL